MFFWLELEPGWLRAVLFNVMLIAGISTVLFNANPLLRFDGYYILADLIEIPNLRVRGAQYLQSVFERQLFGLEAPAPESSARERVWLVFFTIASFIYRLFVTFAIALFIAGQYFIIGVVLAIFAVVMAIVLPLAQGGRLSRTPSAAASSPPARSHCKRRDRGRASDPRVRCPGPGLDQRRGCHLGAGTVGGARPAQTVLSPAWSRNPEVRYARATR